MRLDQEIDKVLDSIRPYLHADGGDVEVVEVKENKDVILRLTGNCSSCNMSEMTMTAGIEESLRRSIPDLGSITAVKE
ncbi:NifU family protein [Bacteroidia bacterium]|nr:NifU family protein [Bacteroidia bacterium]MDA9213801.1 NifU family protein [Bacteroidia bacterium]